MANFSYLKFISKRKPKELEKLFRSLSQSLRSSLPLASLAVVRGEASQLGAPGFGTERARLVVVIVEMLM